MASEVLPAGVSQRRFHWTHPYLSPSGFSVVSTGRRELARRRGEETRSHASTRNCFPRKREPCARPCPSAGLHNVTPPPPLSVVLSPRFSAPFLRVFAKSFSACQLSGRTDAAKHPSAPSSVGVDVGVVARDACEFSVLPKLLPRKSFLSHFCPAHPCGLARRRRIFSFVSCLGRAAASLKKVVPFLARTMTQVNPPKLPPKAHGNAFLARALLSFRFPRRSSPSARIRSVCSHAYRMAETAYRPIDIEITLYRSRTLKIEGMFIPPPVPPRDLR